MNAHYEDCLKGSSNSDRSAMVPSAHCCRVQEAGDDAPTHRLRFLRRLLLHTVAQLMCTKHGPELVHGSFAAVSVIFAHGRHVIVLRVGRNGGCRCALRSWW